MSHLIELYTGAAPWLPDSKAVLVREYQYDDFPLSGIVRQYNVEFLFLCVAGAEEPVNFWAYIHLLPAQREWLDKSASPDEFEERLLSLSHDGPAMLAVASDRLGIIAGRVFEGSDQKSLSAAAEALQDELRDLFEEAKALTPAL
jgi:hypothetical protein